MATISVILLSFIIVLYVLLGLGFPLGFLAWGGKDLGELPKDGKIKTVVSIPGQLFAIYILLKLSEILAFDGSILITIFGYVFFFFFIANTILNALSKSISEKLIMTPVALFIAITFGYYLFF